MRIENKTIEDNIIDKQETKTESKQLLNSLRVLYVEDDPEALQELAYFLKKRVASLKTAVNGLEALEICKNQSFDAIICDLWMPEMDGLTFVKHIRDTGLQTPVIITSAFSDIDTILKAVELGIVKYCVKPLEIEDLIGSLVRIAHDKLTMSGKLITTDNRIMEREERLEIEKNLKRLFAHQLKLLTGKGPRSVHVALGVNDLEIWATDVLSPLETALIGTADHAGLVPYIRKSIYTSYKKTFETIVSDTLGRPATVEEVRNGIEENTDWIVFKLL